MKYFIKILFISLILVSCNAKGEKKLSSVNNNQKKYDAKSSSKLSMVGSEGRSSKNDSSTLAKNTSKKLNLRRDKNDKYIGIRNELVDKVLVPQGIHDALVISAMKNVPRHLFVPDNFKSIAYLDRPLPIGNEQTISQPFVVAYMTQLLECKPDDKVLEIGTGSGYQAAVLAEIVKEVYSIEIIKHLANKASSLLVKLGYDNVHVKHGDGYQGWTEHAPFDKIIITAAPDHVPQPLVEQLAVGGKMILPVGERFQIQNLLLITKNQDSIIKEVKEYVMFVPMTGEASTNKR